MLAAAAAARAGCRQRGLLQSGRRWRGTAAGRDRDRREGRGRLAGRQEQQAGAAAGSGWLISRLLP